MSNARAVGRILKSLRTLTGHSQVEIAARAGISAGTLSLAESGRRPLAPTTTIRLLALLATARGDEDAPRPAA
jgi:transcriptional regulator with XRE-family HTH domain